MNNQLVTIPVPGTSTPIMAVQNDGTEWVAARHICNALGIEWSAQRNKLKGKAWATVALIDTVGADGKQREMSMVDRRTLTMWLATIDTNRVSEAAPQHLRPTSSKRLTRSMRTSIRVAPSILVLRNIS